jgi:hypothetical protein
MTAVALGPVFDGLPEGVQRYPNLAQVDSSGWNRLMLKTWQYWILTLMALLAAVLVVANAMLFTSNRTAQTEVAGRQDYIQKSIQFEGLYREIVKALADLSIRNQDQDLRNLLAAHGVTVTLQPPAASATPSPRK